MAESIPDQSNSFSDDKDVKAPNVFERAKEEIDVDATTIHTEKSSHQKEETRREIDENASLSDVKAPNVFDRAKEEIEALVQTIHHKKDSQTNGIRVETKVVESKPNSLSSDGDVKAPNVFEKSKEEIEPIIHTEKSPHHHKETHGMRDDIDEDTPVNDVKAPNLFERAKEEVDAFVQAIHPKKESQTNETRDEPRKAELTTDSLSENDVKAPNRIEKPKEDVETTKKDVETTKKDVEATIHTEKKSSIQHHHRKETHGMSDDIDENTPIDEVKGPSVFERAKEELEALVQTIHPKKEGGFGSFIGRGLEKVCRPWKTKRT